MNKKSLAFIIFILAVVGAYGLFYAAVTAVLMPQDLNEFKNELDTMPQLPVINASTINEMENSAAVMESHTPLKHMSQSQRTSMANQMRNYNTMPLELLNQNFTANNAYNNYRALAYAMILKGDLSNEIKNFSNTTEEVSNFAKKDGIISQKMATDFENGDDKAYADDLRNIANNMKQYNSKMVVFKTQLQNIVNQLNK
jgi:hypothetical protein